MIEGNGSSATGREGGVSEACTVAITLGNKVSVGSNET